MSDQPRENFYDAVSADPDMTPAQKEKWLATESQEDAYARGHAAGQVAELKRVAKVICPLCQDDEHWEPAERDTRGGWVHVSKLNGQRVICAAAFIWTGRAP